MRIRPLAISLLLFAGFALAGIAVVNQGEELLRAQQREASARVAAGGAYALEQQLSRSLSTTYALASVIREHGRVDSFETLAAEMMAVYGGVSSLQLAPNGVVARVFPLAGNEVVLGHDLLNAPDRRFQARQALETRRLTLAGPLKLLQGGTGVVGRLAVFIPDDSEAAGERFWGFVIAVIRLDDLIDAVQFERLTSHGYAWELTRLDRESGATVRIADGGEPLDRRAERVSFPVELQGAQWTFAVAPDEARSAAGFPLQHAAAVSCAALLAVLAFFVLRQPARLRREVAERTAELAADVERRRRAEAALSLTQQVVDRAVLAIAWADEDGRLSYVNDAFWRLGGRERTERSSVWDALPGFSRAQWESVREELRSSASVIREIVIEAQPVRNAILSIEQLELAGQPVVVIFARDVTAERRAADQLQHAQKMDAIGQLAGGIAHDFNNVLTGVLAHASLLEEETSPGSDARESATAIVAAARRATELTKQLLGFSRRAKIGAAPVDVHAVVGEVTRLLGRTLDKRIEVVQALHAVDGAVLGDAGQLLQAVLNLAVNARDAMPSGGVLSFETAVVELDDAWCSQRGVPRAGRYLAISVGDTGHGMPREIQARVFEPFFTTKEAGRGTGMGLAMVYGFARQHAGAVEVWSEPGRGSRFTLYLPLHDGTPAAAAEHEPVARGGGSGVVLVVDDDDVPRTAAAALLRRAGFEPVLVAGGEQAVEQFRERWREVSVVLLDLAMPGVDGAACFRRLREIDPQVRVVLTTGYDPDGRLPELLDEGVVALVPKPFGQQELIAAVALAASGITATRAA